MYTLGSRSILRASPLQIFDALPIVSSDRMILRQGMLRSIRYNFPKYVVSLDEFDISRNGIKHRNIRKFLLMSERN